MNGQLRLLMSTYRGLANLGGFSSRTLIAIATMMAWLNNRIVLPVVICAALLAGIGAAQEINEFDELSFAGPADLLKLDPGVYQSLPGVYQVHVSGTRRVECPKVFEVDFMLLKAGTESFRKEVGLDPSVPVSYVRWLQLAAEPARYLQPSKTIGIYETETVGLGSGSCYAIDRKGILLTNRHVIQGETGKFMNFDEVIVSKLPPVAEFVQKLVDEIGPWQGKDKEDEFVQREIFGWLGLYCKKTTKVTDVKVAVAYSPRNVFEKSKIGPMSDMERHPKLIPARVIAQGGEQHVDDIAILKLEGDVTDALICLSLASPANVRASAQVYTLGFPGYRYDFRDLTPRDKMSVTVQGGKVVRTPRSENLNLSERLKVRALGVEGVENLLFVSARMSFGSSGGPVILADGTVAGMTVCGAHLPPDSETNEKPQPSATDPSLAFWIDRRAALRESIERSFQEMKRHSRDRNLAVPVANIRAFLDKHGIHPDAGPATSEWKLGLEHYRNGRYTESVKVLESLLDRQVYSGPATQPFEITATLIKSHYVTELLALAKERATK